MNLAQNNFHELYDLVVIGGGINGVAIARDAALRNLKVILLEKSDFGCGASTKTSKLAHGGIRYLEQFQFSLVKESLKERSLLLKNAPHLVKPLPFLFPVYSKDPYSLWQINLGLFVYDYLAGKNGLPRHQRINAQAILKEIPDLKSEGLSGGCFYYDAQMFDNRIVIETLISAENAGARVYNHSEVVDLIKDHHQIVGVVVHNAFSGKIEHIYGKTVVNATGAWSATISKMEPQAEHCLPAPTKGVHLIVPQIIANTALILRAPQDGRVFFVLPWEQYSLVGTTDTFFEGDIDKPSIDSQDCHYLLTALNAFFPEKQFTESSVISAFVGLRPLIAPNKRNSPSDIVREHAIQVSEGGLVTILGGKYTTHRKIAEEVVDAIIHLKSDKKAISCRTNSEPLPGASGPYLLSDVKNKLIAAGMQKALVYHLLNTYGTLSLKILDIMREYPEEAKQICMGHPHIFAEITYSVYFEHVKTISDWFLRRTTIAYTPCQGKRCASRVADKLAVLLGWSRQRAQEEIALYLSSLPW